ncbi:hypothetical protein [Sphingobium sp. MK2]|uniref:hypothetical protein n=1 Tax=Sphingobium sp. MK2 TaxID=3116540 RepID=UPI0032E35BA9
MTEIALQLICYVAICFALLVGLRALLHRAPRRLLPLVPFRGVIEEPYRDRTSYRVVVPEEETMGMCPMEKLRLANAMLTWHFTMRQQ